jgi:hypothetical protein
MLQLKSLAISVQSKIREVIGFDPTVRNIIEVFTTAVEVLWKLFLLYLKVLKKMLINLEKTISPKI